MNLGTATGMTSAAGLGAMSGSFAQSAPDAASRDVAATNGNGSTFSRIYAGSKAAFAQTAPKANAAARCAASEPKSAAKTPDGTASQSVPRHSADDLARQAGRDPSAAATGTQLSTPVTPTPAAQADNSGAPASGERGASGDENAATIVGSCGADSAAAAISAAPMQTKDMVTALDTGTAGQDLTAAAGDGTSSSTDKASAGPTGGNPAMDDAKNASTEGNFLWATSDPPTAAAATQDSLSSNTNATATAGQAQGNAAEKPENQDHKNAVRESEQVQQAGASAGQMSPDLPSGTSAVGAQIAANEGTSKSIDQNKAAIARQIAQQIQPGLGALGDGVSGIAVPSATAQGDSASGGEKGSGHGGTASSGQGAVQNAAATHSPGSAKIDDGTDETASSNAIANAAANARPDSANAVAGDSATSAMSSATAHLSAQAVAAQAVAHAAGDAGGSTKGADANTNTGASEQTPPAQTSASSLPRSLSEVSQAAQLYQRVGGAEMHIAMDTDLLGSIDLRAVVHQGSLSATIGVQRGDVQSLLVNELPALQHSLAEKNLQVGQISVTAGSVGGGANPHEQGTDKQQGQSPSAPVAPIYRDDSPVKVPPHVSAAASLARSMYSTRLSVIA